MKNLYFLLGLIIIISIIGCSAQSGWLNKTPSSLFIIFAYIIGYFTHKESIKC
jgi:hypothetical protein